MHGQFDDNELDVAYYSEVKNEFKLKVNLTSKMLTGLFFSVRGDATIFWV